MKFRKKPIVVEAWQYDGTTISNSGWPEWLRKKYGEGFIYESYVREGYLEIKTLEGYMSCEIGDWVIKGVKDEIYPCKPDIFEATYEKVEEVGECEHEFSGTELNYCKKCGVGI